MVEFSNERIHAAISRAANVCGLDDSDDSLTASYLDYAMSIIVGRAFGKQKLAVNVKKVELRQFIILLPSQNVIRLSIIYLENTSQYFSICDALFIVTTIQLLKASRRLARAPPSGKVIYNI